MRYRRRADRRDSILHAHQEFNAECAEIAEKST
jgi:hypothetical protein